MNVVKVDRDVAYVAIVVHVYCKILFIMFHLFFRRMLQVCLSRYCICFTQCCKCFIWMLLMFCNGFQVFSGVFTSVLDACFKCFIYLHICVSNIASGCFKSISGVAHEFSMLSNLYLDVFKQLFEFLIFLD
jgi:hypothetical protein